MLYHGGVALVQRHRDVSLVLRDVGVLEVAVVPCKVAFRYPRSSGQWAAK